MMDGFRLKFLASTPKNILTIRLDIQHLNHVNLLFVACSLLVNGLFMASADPDGLNFRQQILDLKFGLESSDTDHCPIKRFLEVSLKF